MLNARIPSAALFVALIAAIVSAPLTPLAHAQGQPSLLQQFGDWGVYTGNNSGQKVCFALSEPTSAQTDPPNRPRDPVYFFISTRPGENVRNEVSVIIGYPFRANSEASAEVGGTKFALQTQSDNAWMKSNDEEARLVDAMRRGSEIIIRGVSGRGTQTTDRYSLRGLSQALDRVAQECR